MRVDGDAHRVIRAGTEIGIEPKAFAVLCEFLTHPGQMLSRDHLLDAVWGHSYVTPATLNRIIVQLRRALGDDVEAPRCIQTVHGLGYRFIASFTRAPEAAGAPPATRFMPPPHARLPERIEPLIGRERVIAELKALIANARLVTVTGAGGIGKTQAALEAARVSAQAFRDGVWLFDLTPFAGADRLARTLADAFGIRGAVSTDDAMERLVEVLRTRHALLVLDNCERVAELLGRLIAPLLSHCAGLHVLVTSQQRLNCVGETLYSLSPLEAPAQGEWTTDAEIARLSVIPAVQLLLVRSRSLASGFTLTPANAAAVAELCRRLDGLPLALELAAARLRLLSPEQLLSRMGDRFQWHTDSRADRPARHQTLGALIEWSFALLSEQEQALLCALGVFDGGWTLDGAATIGAVFGLDGEQTFELLSGLVDKSLVTIDPNINPPRYRLLDSVRLFALARLVDSGDETRARRAHLAHFIDVTARADAEIRGARQSLWFGRILREFANLHAAFDYAHAQPDLADSAVTLVANLCWWFRIHGEYFESARWLDIALQASHTQTLDRARALVANGIIHYHRRSHACAKSLLREGVELATQLGDAWLAAIGQTYLAFELAVAADFAGAERCVESALTVADAQADGWLRSLALLSRGLALALRGRHTEAAAWLNEAVELVSSPEGDGFQRCYTLINRALLRFHLDDVRGAARDWLRTLDVSVDLQHRRGQAGCVESAAYLALKQGQAADAARFLAAAARVRELTSAPLFPQWQLTHAAAEDGARKILGPAFETTQAQGAAARFEDVVEEARALLTELGG
ncbi:MAG: winged helix-turn-helix domain-containing protein [Rhodanobacteraceae bacterium]